MTVVKLRNDSGDISHRSVSKSTFTFIRRDNLVRREEKKGGRGAGRTGDGGKKRKWRVFGDSVTLTV